MLTEADWQNVSDRVSELVLVHRAVIWRNSGPRHHLRLLDASSRTPRVVPRSDSWLPMEDVMAEMRREIGEELLVDWGIGPRVQSPCAHHRVRTRLQDRLSLRARSTRGA